VIPAAFDYQRATSVDDALAKLAASNGTGKLIAGGHSLVPTMKMRLAQPSVLIDIARVPALSGIREQGGTLEIGACTTHHDIASSPLLGQRAPALAEAAAAIGDPQVRHRGTLGGSLAHADPSADYPAAILALDAEIHVQGPRGARRIAAADFFRDLFTVDVQPDELIVAVSFAPAPVSGYAKLRQRASHFAIVGVAAALDVRDGVVQGARVGLTGATPHAVRLTSVEQALAGKPGSEQSLAAAVAGAGEALADVNADLHGSAEYRRAMVGVFARRALQRALERARTT
jgi:aerobic carbon-monoxide dehydrogenase medium subunit